MGRSVGRGVDGMTDRRRAVRLDAVQDDATADPDHGGGADRAEKYQEDGHAPDEGMSQTAADTAHGRGIVVLRQRHTGVVGLHDQRYHAIHRDGDPDCDNRQHNGLLQEAPSGQRRQCNRHDLRREDEIGLDGARDLLVLERLRLQRHRAELGLMLVCMMGHDGFVQFFNAFVAEIGPAKHQKRGDCRGQEVAERQRSGKQDQELVAKRSRRDLAHDRQFALGRESDHVTWRDRGIVDDDAGRLYPRLGGLADHIVKGSRCHLCDRRDIVEKGDQSDAHR